MDFWKKPRSVETELSLQGEATGITAPQSRFNTVPFLAPARHFDPLNPELIDRPEVDREAIRQELQALEDTNRRFGGHQLALFYADRLVRDTGLTSLSVLDLGTGRADIPRALVAWGRKKGMPIEVTAVDINPKVLDLARPACRDWPEITLAQENMLNLPYSRSAFDLVICSMALHHFERADAVLLLRTMQGIARAGVIVNDLRRNWLSIWFTEVLARTVIKTEIVRHDAAYSSRAAFTVEELKTIAEEADLRSYQIHRHHLIFRMVLEART